MPTHTQLEQQAFNRLLRLERKYEIAVQEQLKNALVTMRGEMAEIYEKYAVNGKLTRVQMTKYNRYVAMEKQMLAAMDPAIKNSLKIIDRLTPNQYRDSFFQYAWAMDNGTGLRINYGVLNMDTVRENLVNPWVNIAKDRFKLSGKLYIRAALNDGLVLGKSYAQMSRDLGRATQRSFYEASRIIRTEGQAAVNAGQSDLYTRAGKAGVDGNQIWDATLDGSTRPTHGAMDGQAKQADGFYNGPGSERAPYPAWYGLSAAERIHCRCHERFQIEGYSPQLRRTRDGGVDDYQSYEEWNKPKVEK